MTHIVLYPAMLQCSKTNCTEKSRNRCRSNDFKIISTVSSITSTLYCYHFLQFPIHESDTGRYVVCVLTASVM